ncbi:MAG: hypothetical protein WCG97_02815 [bacterium]
MAINVAIEKNQAESPASVLRRFSKRMNDSGVLPRVRGIRYAERTLSHYKTKMARLERLRRKGEYEKLAKLGKLPVKTRRK